MGISLERILELRKRRGLVNAESTGVSEDDDSTGKNSLLKRLLIDQVPSLANLSSRLEVYDALTKVGDDSDSQE